LFLTNLLQNLINCGTTTIGAISSNNFDLEACIKSPINVVFFNEVLGSKPDMIDLLFNDFKQKLTLAKKYTSKNFIPAIAIHSPYSTHPILIKETLKIAKKENFVVQTHFLESDAELNWLEYSKGEFSSFFKNFLNQTKSLQTPKEFLELFDGINNLSFTHCTFAKNYINDLKKLKANIIHCPNSNRLLTNSKLNLDEFSDFNIAIATDGLSSNYSINLFDEIKSALFLHTNYNPNELAKKLLKMAIINGAKTLNLNKGSLEVNKDADLICFNLEQINESNSLELNIILNFTKTKYTFIGGKNETV